MRRDDDRRQAVARANLHRRRMRRAERARAARDKIAAAPVLVGNSVVHAIIVLRAVGLARRRAAVPKAERDHCRRIGDEGRAGVARRESRAVAQPSEVKRRRAGADAALVEIVDVGARPGRRRTASRSRNKHCRQRRYRVAAQAGTPTPARPQGTAARQGAID